MQQAVFEIDEDASDAEEVHSENDSGNSSPSQIPAVDTGCLNVKTPAVSSPAPLSMPVSIDEYLPSTPALLPSLSQQSANSKSNSTDTELPTPPPSLGSISKLWLRLPRPKDKKLVSEKGLVSGASQVVRSVSSAFIKKSTKQ
jgi:hypothetical protein